MVATVGSRVVFEMNIDPGKAVSRGESKSHGKLGRRDRASALLRMLGLCLSLMLYCIMHATTHFT
jgi:hypothetical protein